MIWVHILISLNDIYFIWIWFAIVIYFISNSERFEDYTSHSKVVLLFLYKCSQCYLHFERFLWKTLGDHIPWPVQQTCRVAIGTCVHCVPSLAYLTRKSSEFERKFQPIYVRICRQCVKNKLFVKYFLLTPV